MVSSFSRQADKQVKTAFRHRMARLDLLLSFSQIQTPGGTHMRELPTLAPITYNGTDAGLRLTCYRRMAVIKEEAKELSVPEKFIQTELLPDLILLFCY